MRALPDNNLKYPVLIKIGSGTGSGFYLNFKDEALYLVTARHVLFDSQGGNKLKSDSLKTVSYAEDDKIKDPIIFEIDLKFLNNTTGNIFADENHDIVAVKLTQGTGSPLNGIKQAKPIAGVRMLQLPPGATIITAEIIRCKKTENVLIGNDVYITGYPTSLGNKKDPQFDYEKPLVRKGIIAGKNDKKGTIILDCGVHHGNSGGIVLELEQRDIRFKDPWVIGVITERIRSSETRRAPNSGYSIIVPIERVLELIENRHNV